MRGPYVILVPFMSFESQTDQFHLFIAGCPLNVPAMSGLGVHFEEIEENVSSSEICDSINLALDAVLNWLQEAHGSQVNK